MVRFATFPTFDYAGPVPRKQLPFPVRVGLAIGWLLWILTCVVVIAVRLTLLGAGFILLAVGTLFLGLGGKRTAAAKVRAALDRFYELLQLWASDIAHPFRQWLARRRGTPAAQPIPLLTFNPSARS